MRIQLKITGLKGEDRIIDLCDTLHQLKEITVAQLKTQVSEELLISDEFRICYQTEKLVDSKLLNFYNIRHMSTLHLVLVLDGGI